MNAPSATFEEPPLTDETAVALPDLAVTIIADATPHYPAADLVLSAEERRAADARERNAEVRARLKENDAGIDLGALLSQEKKQTRVSLSQVIELKRGMIDREARKRRELLQDNPEDVEELLRQLLVVKLTTDKISDQCYEQLQHLLRGLRNAKRFKTPY